MNRKTKETGISVKIDLDHSIGGASPVVSTGLKCLDDLVLCFVSESGIGCEVKCGGDLWIDDHHLVEDVGIALGQGIKKGLGDKKGCNRMWSEVHGGVRCTLDLSNRPHYEGGVAWGGEGVVDDARAGEGEVCKERGEVRG